MLVWNNYIFNLFLPNIKSIIPAIIRTTAEEMKDIPKLHEDVNVGDGLIFDGVYKIPNQILNNY